MQNKQWKFWKNTSLGDYFYCTEMKIDAQIDQWDVSDKHVLQHC